MDMSGELPGPLLKSAILAHGMGLITNLWTGKNKSPHVYSQINSLIGSLHIICIGKGHS